MKLKLTNEELTIFLLNIQRTDGVTFNTRLEQRMSICILKDFIKRLLKKAVDQKAKISIDVDDQTMLVLAFIMPQIQIENMHSKSVFYTIFSEIHRLCQSI